MAPKRNTTEETAVNAQATTATLTSPRPLTKPEIMRLKLEAQPKVTIMIPLAPGESEGSTHPVILNGHRLNIRKGTYVQVPEQVAQVVMESQQQTQAAIQNHFAMDGNGVSDAMRQK